MKRILLLATIAALMAVMLVGAASAFAHDVSCTGHNPGLLQPAETAANPDALAADRDGDGFVCKYERFKDGVLVSTRYRDDHEAP